MQSLYQGKIDVFCAAYAVLNGLRTTHNLQLLRCRELFHQALQNIAQDPTIFAKVLAQNTDYVFWVDQMLQEHAKLGILDIKKPFATTLPQPAELFGCIERWITTEIRAAALFQFVRQLPLTGQKIYHWTACSHLKDNVLYFNDSCLDDTALHSIAKNNLIPEPTAENSDQIYIFPHTLRLIKPKLGPRPVPYK